MSMAATRVQPRVEVLESRLAPDATTYVQALYLDVLERPADPAGLNYWVTQLSSGQLSHAEVAAGFWFSAEHRTLQVTDYYTLFLNRAPDPGGLNHWVNQFLNGESEYEVIEEFVTSDEYFALNPTADAYVRALFADVRGRTPTPQEVTFWVQRLQDPDGFDDDQDDDDSDDNDSDDNDSDDDQNDGGFPGTDEVVEAFLTSDDHFLRVIDQYYLTFLNRPGDPQGRQGWLQVLRNGNVQDGNVDDGLDDEFFQFNDAWSFEKLAVFFLSSQEYIVTH